MNKMNLSDEPYIISRGYPVKDIEFTCNFCETKFKEIPKLCGTYPITDLDRPNDIIMVSYNHKCPICGVECIKEVSKQYLKSLKKED